MFAWAASALWPIFNAVGRRLSPWNMYQAAKGAGQNLATCCLRLGGIL